MEHESEFPREDIIFFFNKCKACCTEPSEKKQATKFLRDHGIASKISSWIVEKTIPKLSAEGLSFNKTLADFQFTVCWMLVSVLAIMINGTVTQQLHFFFDLFDLNGDGLLQVSELIIFIEALHEQQRLDGLTPSASPQAIIENIMQEADDNGDGCLSMEELLTHSKFIARKLNLGWRRTAAGIQHDIAARVT
eukprot:TRINITY_DN3005_c0_g1_i2.p1 TRINITY_DN3005_c0_g1~~TRINITY_DN3005_c0_g1_i2.p1  ORF type:complete len:193 (+),score=64.69 TRINITY_DN3005_c0_g1_i2:157-735(+)